MATKAKRKRAGRQAPAPKQPARSSVGLPRWLYAAAALGVIGLAVAVVLVTRSGSSPSGGTLPATSDYHSLLISSLDPNDIRLGTHQGIYRSTDGGRSWRFETLSGSDAMNLGVGGGSGGTIWVAGHNVFAKSGDGGRTWEPLSPPTLPSLDIHGFAVDPRSPRTLFAAVAGQGLYESTNGGASFTKRSDVGASVMAVAVTPSGAVLAGDMQQGLLASRDSGRTWNRVLNAPVMGLSVNSSDTKLVLAAGPGIFRSADGGQRWRQVFALSDRLGPVAWAPSDPKVAYAVGYDRNLYVSRDGGTTWQAVSR